MLSDEVLVDMRRESRTVGSETSTQLAHPLSLVANLVLIFFFHKPPMLPKPSLQRPLTLSSLLNFSVNASFKLADLARWCWCLTVSFSPLPAPARCDPSSDSVRWRLSTAGFDDVSRFICLDLPCYKLLWLR